MFFPYLRGKQEEILAVLEADFLSELTVPIFEPTNTSPLSIGRWQRAVEAGRRFAIVTNSANGDPAPAQEEVRHVIEDDLSPEAVYPGLEIRAGTDTGTIRDFAETFQDRVCVVVHRDHLYAPSELSGHLGPLADSIVHVLIDGRVSREVVRQLPARGRVLLRDGFAYEPRNADYQPQTNFGDLLHTFSNDGFDGFGDFAIAGDRFSARGGPAYAVALHLTEITPMTVIANHVVSSPPHIRGDLSAKYLDAVQRLVGYADERGFDTVGINAFRNSLSERHYPGLGKPKRWSILHHLEIIDRELTERGAAALS